MSITNFINRVSRATDEIKEAITRKGVVVGECDSLEDMPDRIDEISVQSGGGGEEVYTVLAFCSSPSKPVPPTGGSLTETSVNYPSGWSDGSGLTSNVWMSYASFTETGIKRDWSSPVQINGAGSSVDLTNYALQSWVLDQIKNSVKNGTIDLSNYATKSYVDEKIADLPGGSTGVKSINDLNGDVVLEGSSSVSIFKSGNTLTFTASGGSGGGGGDDGDTIRSFNIYQNTDSRESAPSIATSPAPVWNYSIGELDNCPSGWSTDMTYEKNKFTWMASAFFSKKNSGKMIGSWEGPICITGVPGEPGKDGDDGISPNTSFKSIVFKRTNTEPPTPTGGSYSDPVPSGWSDGIPAGEEIVWMSSRILSSDGKAPQQSTWSKPSQISDTAFMDYEFSSVENPGEPSKATPTSPEGNPNWRNEASETTIWMAMRDVSNGAYAAGSSWKIIKVKGEKGADGTSVKIKGKLDDPSKLPTSGNEIGDAYLIDGNLYVWDGDSWENVGKIKGDPGEPGKSQYLHIKYSDDGGKTFTSNNGETPGDYIGMYVDYVSEDSTDVKKYTWKYWRGEDGFGYEYIFKTTVDYVAPDVPSTSENTDDYVPEGWSDNALDVSEEIPYCWWVYRKKTEGTWGKFIGSSSNPGKAALHSSFGKHGTSYEYIYALTSDYTVVPAYPSSDSERKSLFDAAEQNKSTTYNGQIWADNAQSIDPETYKTCWVANRIKYAGSNAWVYSSNPIVWANWGSDGTDGDGVEYVFYLTNNASFSNGKWSCTDADYTISYTNQGMVNGIPTAYDNTIDDWVPQGWTDEPQDVSKDHKYEFCAKRKSKDGVWQNFSTPALWANYSEDGKPGKDGDTYATARLFIAHSSYDEAPAVPTVTSTFDKNTRTVINPPTGWAASATKTSDKPYIWTIWGAFSETTGKQIGNWSDPYCITGAPGPKGEDGDEIVEVYAISNESVVPTIKETDQDSNGKTKADDGYLPKFVFTNETKEAVAEQPSVSDTALYCWATKRRKHNGSWLEFASPYMIANFVKAGLTDEEKEQIKTDVTNNVKDELNTANQKVTAIETRLDKIDGTNATYLVDNKEGIVKALTQYKTDNQTSFSDLVLDGSDAKFNAMTGAYIKDKNKEIVSGAGLDIDGINATVEQWGIFKDVDNMTLSSVRQELNAANATATTAATKANEAENSVTNAMTKWDGDKATITSDVSKSRWFWVEEETVTLSNGETIIKMTDNRAEYDISKVDGVTYKTVEEYENAMKAQGFTKELVSDALSRISQEAGKITLAANEGSSWASIVAKANADGDSELCLDADRINLSGTTNATKAVIGNATITDATITNGTITNAKINSCEIASQIKSKTYNNGDNGEAKKGFLFDAGSNDGEFAIYYNPKDSTTDDASLLEISSKRIQLPATTVTGLLTAAEISGANITARTITADQIQVGAIGANEIAANAITAGKIAAGAITTEKLDAEAITADKIATGTITAKQLQTGVIEGVVDGKLSKLTIKADSIDFSGDNKQFIANFNKQDGLIVKGVKSTEFAKPTYDSDGNLETSGKGFYLTSKDEGSDYKGDGKSHFALYGSKTFEETDSAGAKTTVSKPFIISDDDIRIPSACITNLETSVIRAVNGSSDLDINADNITFGNGSGEKIIAAINNDTLSAEKIKVKNLEITGSIVGGALSELSDTSIWEKISKKIQTKELSAGEVNTNYDGNTSSVYIKGDKIQTTDASGNTTLLVTGSQIPAITQGSSIEKTLNASAIMQGAGDVVGELNYSSTVATSTYSINGAKGMTLSVPGCKIEWFTKPDTAAEGLVNGDYIAYNITASISVNGTTYREINPSTYSAGNLFATWNESLNNWEWGSVEGGSSAPVFEMAGFKVEMPADATTVTYSLQLDATITSQSGNISNFIDQVQFFLRPISSNSTNQIVFETASTESGTVIGQNGFRTALGSDSMAEFVQTEDGGSFIIRTGGSASNTYGVKVLPTGLTLIYQGKEYVASTYKKTANSSDTYLEFKNTSS